MLRFKIMASALPLLVPGVFAHGELASSTQPCIAIGGTSVRIASEPWQTQLRVSFTTNPAVATVRVQITESAEAADFVVVNDAGSAEGNACEANAATRFVGIATKPSPTRPIIYLSQDGNADYRIFVNSKTFTPRDAAALIVGASGGHGRIAAASL